ncbi:MAG: response regulator [Deltaproteobacteria bacterium]|nr:response regulator [Deltaproteobacteria bacterium]
MEAPLLMIIDDEFGVRESLKMVFGKQYRVLEADSVDVALPIVQETRPQVILLDVMMPKTDGFEMLQRLKEIDAGCEVIMLTGVNSQQLAEKAKDFGACDFVGKPFDIVEIRNKVAQAFERIAQKNPPPPLQS